jgi:hypothetical protein
MYTDVAALATDGNFRNRIAACASTEQVVGADLGGLHPTAWADTYQWQIASSPGFGDAYASAVAGGVENPGADPAVVTDEQVLAAVQAVFAATSEVPDAPA